MSFFFKIFLGFTNFFRANLLRVENGPCGSDSSWHPNGALVHFELTSQIDTPIHIRCLLIILIALHYIYIICHLKSCILSKIAQEGMIIYSNDMFSMLNQIKFGRTVDKYLLEHVSSALRF